MDTIRAVGVLLLFLPEYSPDLNSIEQFFSELEHWLRHAAARTDDAVFNAIEPILDAVTPKVCSNHVEHVFKQTENPLALTEKLSESENRKPARVRVDAVQRTTTITFTRVRFG